MGSRRPQGHASPLKYLPWFFGLAIVSWCGMSMFQRNHVFSATKNVTVCVSKSKIIVATNNKKSCAKSEKKIVLSAASSTSPELCINTRKKSISITTSGQCGAGQTLATRFSKGNSIRSCINGKSRQIQFLSGSRCSKGFTLRSLPLRKIETTSIQEPAIATSTSTTSSPPSNATSTSTTVQNPSGTTTTTVLATTTSTTSTTVPSVTTTTVAPATISSFSASQTTINQGQSTSLTATWSGASASVNQSIGSIGSGVSTQVSPNVTTTYTLTVSNGAGHSVTQAVTIYVNSLSIATQPQDITTDNPFGENFSVSVNATGALSYQWYKNSQPISNAIGPSYRATQDGTYYVIITSVLNGVSRTQSSNTASFFMNSISIVTQPTSALIGDGQTATFTVSAIATGSLSYQWKVNGAEVAGATFDSYTSTTYGTHQVIVTSTLNGMATSVASSSAWLDVNTVSITSETTNDYVTTGTTSALGVSVSSHGGATVSYQWFRNNVEISGQNSIGIDVTQGGTYKIRVTSQRGGTTAVVYSSNMTVTELAAPSVSSFNASPWVIGSGNSTQLTPNFSGGSGVITPGNITVTDGVAVSVSPSTTTTYTLTVTNLAGRDVSYPITVHVTTGTFTATANNSSADRMNGHSAVTLTNGKVLVFGNWADTNVTDLYDPTTNSFTRVGNMIRGRRGHTTVRLQDGRVLAIGGRYFNSTSGVDVTLNSVEVFDPATETWSSTGSMNVARENFFSTLLPNGKVLVVGGMRRAPGTTYLSSVEIYDPSTGVFTYTNSMPQTRGEAIGVTLANGKVLIAGGYSDASGHMKSAILFDPSTNAWSSISSQMNTVHYAGSATVLMNDGRVIIAGGWSPSTGVSAIEIFNPSNNTFASAASLPSFSFGRGSLTGHLLDSGLVAFFGGSSGVGTIADTAVLYDPVSNTLTTEVNTMRWWRYYHASAKLNDGRVVIIGGNSSNRTAADVYAP